MAICTSITLVRSVPNMGDLLQVTIDNSTKAYWFYSQADAMQFVGQEVIVEYRKDILNGNPETFIKTFTVPTRINTLDKVENIKLYLEQSDNNSNVSFSEIADGETKQGCVVLCTKQEFKTSPNATWHELSIRDKSMHVATLRIFNYTNHKAQFAGKYIRTELSRSKYGFKSEIVYPVSDDEVAPNPELAIAESYIENYFKDDAEARSLIQSTNLMQFLKEYVDYEQGYGMVRLAMELAVVDSMKNITKDINLTAIGEALLCQRIYLTRTSSLSPMVNNIFVAQQIRWSNRALVCQLLDDVLEEKPDEYSVMKDVQKMVSTILYVRKGAKF